MSDFTDAAATWLRTNSTAFGDSWITVILFTHLAFAARNGADLTAVLALASPAERAAMASMSPVLARALEKVPDGVTMPTA